MLIEVYHDTACPWCRIGKRHLAIALERWQGEPVTVQYRTYFLNEAIPQEGYNFQEFMTAKGGGQVPLEMFFDGPRRAGQAVGLVFNFEHITRAPNTLLSHRLIALSPEDQKETVLSKVYDAYFEHGQDIGNLDVLTGIARDCGLDAEAIRTALLSADARDEVIAEARHAQRIGVTGVPFFVIDSAYAFSGAQPPDTMLRVLQQVVELRETSLNRANHD